MGSKSLRGFAAATAFVTILVLYVASGSSAGGSQLTLPAVQGPALSTISGATGAVSQPCLFAVDGLTCYGPYELGKAYNFPSNLDGRGQTIIIVDAYGSPTITSDLAAFDTYFDIPAPPSFKIINTRGTGATGSGDTTDWGVETSLDVEYAHAMAPGANIVLAVAASDNNADLNAAEAEVFPFYPHAIISQSFGDWETDPTAGNTYAVQHRIFEVATALGDTILASAGDAGATWTQYTGTTTPAMASYPASDPLVTGVGGTKGFRIRRASIRMAATAGSRSGTSRSSTRRRRCSEHPVLYPVLAAGRDHYRMRTVPDVSYNAAVDGGVEVFDSPNIYLVGGTSAGSPQLGGHLRPRRSGTREGRAAADRVRQPGAVRARGVEQRHHDDANTYSSDFHDITVGNNALDSPVGFSAGPGYDLATGLGTPDV